MKVDDTNIEDVKQFVYQGSLVTNNNDCSSEMKQRVCIALGALRGFQKIWNNSAISLKTKLQILQTGVFNVLLYASETWTLRKADVNKLTALKMMCYCRILKIEWFHHVTNEEMRHHIEAWSTIIQWMKRHKLSLYGHICQIKDDFLIKLFMQGNIKDKDKFIYIVLNKSWFTPFLKHFTMDTSII